MELRRSSTEWAIKMGSNQPFVFRQHAKPCEFALVGCRENHWRATKVNDRKYRQTSEFYRVIWLLKTRWLCSHLISSTVIWMMAMEFLFHSRLTTECDPRFSVGRWSRLTFFTRFTGTGKASTELTIASSMLSYTWFITTQSTVRLTQHNVSPTAWQFSVSCISLVKESLSQQLL